MMNKNAFTLAEVLITLGIIGVVAALTVPTLVVNAQTKGYKEGFKKNFSSISSATLMIKQDNNETLANAFSSVAGLRDEYKKYLKTTKSCNDSTSEGCWHSLNNWEQYDGAKNGNISSPGMVLADGTLLVFEDSYFSAPCQASTITTLTNVCNNIMIDVNGFKKPNMIGKDIYFVWILSNAVKPWGNDNDTGIALASTCASGQGGWACASKVINNINY